MPTLVGWTLLVVMQVPGQPLLRGVMPPMHMETLEECVTHAKEIMSDFSRPELALCSPIFRTLRTPNPGDPT